ncbi:MAG: hypothetical protein BAJALOKI2v1_360019 [Promethearchaeota archaeon]|nr:MAG: hypothetical protein BAJALOKI2v1_360019 [Candidatus Lokiarchaeota archaeon]
MNFKKDEDENFQGPINEQDPIKELVNSSSIGDYASLSMVEVITLYLLLKNPPMIRYTLYLQIKQFLHPIKKNNKELFFEPHSKVEHRFYDFLKEKKTISTSSFYNNLRNLELRGLVKFIEDDDEGKVYVQATKLSNYIIKFLFQFIANLTTVDFQLERELTNTIEERIGASKEDSLLLVWLKKVIEFNIIDYLRNKVEEMYFLSEEKLYEDLVKFDLNKINFTRIHNNLIREPNDIFEIVLVPHYKKNGNRLELDRIDLLNELIRTTKKGGHIVLITRAKLPRTSNHYANQLLELYEDYFRLQGRIFSEEEIKSDLKEVELKVFDMFEFKGLIITICKVT